MEFHALPNLRHTFVFRVPDAGFAQVELLKPYPEIVVSGAHLLSLIDRCRGMELAVLTTGSHYCLMPVKALVDQCLRAAQLGSGFSVPDLKTLVQRLYVNHRGNILPVVRFPARPGFPSHIPAPVGAPPRQWLLPHPGALQMFWPTDVVAPLSALLRTEPFGALQDVCRRTHAPPAIPLVLDRPQTVLAVVEHAPFFPLLCAALANPSVRRKCLPTRVSLPGQSFWALLLHVLLTRAVDILWPTDALATHGLCGLLGVRAMPIPTHRLISVQTMEAVRAPVSADPLVAFETTLDGPVLPAETVPHKGLMCLPRARYLSLRVEDEWHALPHRSFVQTAETHYVGQPAQVLFVPERDQWFLCPEHRLDDFFLAYSDHTVQVLVDEHRVYRHTDNRWYACPSAAGATAGELRTVTEVAQLPHPLRSRHSNPLVAFRADGSAARFQCDHPGASVCLDPPLSDGGVQDVLSFAALHMRATAPVNTAVFACTPPQYAHFPPTLPTWQPCRIAMCMRCRPQRTALALNGDSALVSRQELPLVLWWHWYTFAEHIGDMNHNYFEPDDAFEPDSIAA